MKLSWMTKLFAGSQESATGRGSRKLRKTTVPVLGATLVGAAAWAAGGATQLTASSTRSNPLPAQVAVSLNTSIDMADQAAISWAQTNASGTGSAKVLKTESDTEGTKIVPVYDINVLAPNSVVFVVQIAKSNFAVLSVSVAENQPYLSTTTTTAPPSTTSTTAPPSTTSTTEPPSTTTTTAPPSTTTTTEPPSTTTTTAPMVSPAIADQAAIAWAEANAAGSGTAKVLETEPEKENMVYEIKVLAPNGSIYEINVGMVTGKVISGHLTQQQSSVDTEQKSTSSEQTDVKSSTDNKDQPKVTSNQSSDN